MIVKQARRCVSRRRVRKGKRQSSPATQSQKKTLSGYICGVNTDCGHPPPGEKHIHRLRLGKAYTDTHIRAHENASRKALPFSEPQKGCNIQLPDGGLASTYRVCWNEEM